MGKTSVADQNDQSENEDANGNSAMAVGELLKAARINRGEEVRDVAARLRIRYRYLEALEEGKIDELPGQAYVLGFIRAYAKHLDLDGEEIVRRFKQVAGGTEDKTNLVFPSPIPDTGIPGGALLFIGLFVSVLAYGVWYLNTSDDGAGSGLVSPIPDRLAQLTKGSQKESEPAEDTPSEDVMVEPAPEAKNEPMPTPEQAEPVVEAPAEPVFEVPDEPSAEVPTEVVSETPAETPDEVLVEVVPSEAETIGAVPEAAALPPEAVPAPAEEPSRVEIRARINSWIQVRDQEANRLLFTRLLRQGDSYHVPSRSGLRLLTGNAGALEILVDGEAVPAIGGEGDVRRDVALDPDRLKQGTAVLDN